MKNTLQRIEPAADGLNLYFDTFGVFIPFEVEEPEWDEAKEMAAKKGHTLLTVDQGFSIIEYTAEIDKAMKEAGKPEFDDWFWLDREHPLRKNAALCVNMLHGLVYYLNKNYTHHVRAVSAFQL